MPKEQSGTKSPWQFHGNRDGSKDAELRLSTPTTFGLVEDSLLFAGKWCVSREWVTNDVPLCLSLAFRLLFRHSSRLIRDIHPVRRRSLCPLSPIFPTFGEGLSAASSQPTFLVSIFAYFPHVRGRLVGETSALSGPPEAHWPAPLVLRGAVEHPLARIPPLSGHSFPSSLVAAEENCEE